MLWPFPYKLAFCWQACILNICPSLGQCGSLVCLFRIILEHIKAKRKEMSPSCMCVPPCAGTYTWMVHA